MEQLSITYSPRGFRVLCFPCNQFMDQEPWPEPQIKEFITENWPNLNAAMFSKIEVNGKDTHPVYNFLKEALPGDITWNFASKFVIGRDGIPVQRFDSAQRWKEIEECIKMELDKEYQVDEDQDEEKESAVGAPKEIAAVTSESVVESK